MSVQVPPKMEAKASGMSSLDGLVAELRAMPTTGGRNIAVTVVLFMKAETPAAVPMRTSRRRFKLPRAIRVSLAPTTPLLQLAF